MSEAQEGKIEKKDAQEKAHLAEEEKETTLLMSVEGSDERLLQGVS